jgi:acyl-CoA dehydrogenase
MEAARSKDKRKSVRDFDAALFGHIGFTISNAVRSLFMALTLARFSNVPETGATKRYFQHINRFSASFAFATDVAMLTLGGYLKKKESLSARLGDVRVVDVPRFDGAQALREPGASRGRPAARRMGVPHAALSSAQEQLHSFLRNFPNRALAGLMRFVIFPRGLQYSAPSDRSGRHLADLVLNATAVRDRLCYPVYREVQPHNPLGLLQEALELSQGAEPIEKRIRVEGVKTGRVTALDVPGQINQALAAGIISETEAAQLRDYDRKVMELIHVDDFAPHELGTMAAAPPREAVPQGVGGFQAA